MADIFISYAREDAEAAERLYQDLTARGFKAWLDKEVLKGGARWKEETLLALEAARYCLVLLSNRSLTKRGFVQREIRFAVEILGEMPSTSTFLIPVRLEPCYPSNQSLRELQFVDLFPDYDAGIRQLCVAVELSTKEASFLLEYCLTHWRKTGELPRFNDQAAMWKGLSCTSLTYGQMGFLYCLWSWEDVVEKKGEAGLHSEDLIKGLRRISAGSPPLRGESDLTSTIHCHAYNRDGDLRVVAGLALRRDTSKLVPGLYCFNRDYPGSEMEVLVVGDEDLTCRVRTQFVDAKSNLKRTIQLLNKRHDYISAHTFEADIA